MRIGAGSSPHPINGPSRRGSGSGGLAGRGSGVPPRPAATWVWATGWWPAQELTGGGACRAGPGLPRLGTPPSPGAHAPPPPSRAWPRVPHTVPTGSSRDRGWLLPGVGLRNVGHPTHWLGALRCSGWALLPTLPAPPWPDWFGSPIRSVIPGMGVGGARPPVSARVAVGCPSPSSPPWGTSAPVRAGCAGAPGSTGGFVLGLRAAGGRRVSSGRARRAGRPPGSRRCAGTCT